VKRILQFIMKIIRVLRDLLLMIFGFIMGVIAMVAVILGINIIKSRNVQELHKRREEAIEIVYSIPVKSYQLQYVTLPEKYETLSSCGKVLVYKDYDDLYPGFYKGHIMVGFRLSDNEEEMVVYDSEDSIYNVCELFDSYTMYSKVRDKWYEVE